MTLNRARISSICGWLAALCLVAMMIVTVAGVVLRHIFGRPIHGVIAIVELFLTGAFFLALPAAFLREDHIVVDIVDHRYPRAVIWLKRFSAGLAVVVLVVMAYQGALVARDMITFGDVTSDLSIPKIWYWVPVLIGIVGGAIAAAWMASDRSNNP